MKNQEKTKNKRTQRDYSLGFKFQLVTAIEKGNMTYKQAQNIYGIQGRSTVLTWLRKHAKIDWSDYYAYIPESKRVTGIKIKRLEQDLDDERIRNLLLNEVVNIMDAEYGDGLRKKYIAKEKEVFKSRK